MRAIQEPGGHVENRSLRRIRAFHVLVSGLLLLANLAPAEAGLEPDIAADCEGNYLVVQEQSTGGIGAQPYNSAGVQIGGGFEVNQSAGETAQRPAVAKVAESPGECTFVAVWESDLAAGVSQSIRGRTFTVDFVDGTADLGTEFEIAAGGGDKIHRTPAVAAAASGNFVVAWSHELVGGAPLRQIEGAFFEGGLVTPIQAHGATLIPRSSPSVSMAPDDSYVIAWQEAGDVVANLFARPTASGTPFLVNVFTSGDQSSPAVAVTGATRDDFVAVWDSADVSSDAGIFSRRFGAGADGFERQVNSAISGDQTQPDVVSDAGGNYTAVWMDEEPSQPGNRIAAQRFTAAGVYFEDEIPVSEGLGSGLPFGRPRVALSPGGGFVTTFADDDMVFVQGLEPSPAYVDCVVGGSTFCPMAGRFRIDVEWLTAGGQGTGRAVAVSDSSGYFWFFDPSNVELAVKVVRACSIDAPCFAVVAAGMTDLGVEITVRDTLSGQTVTYSSPIGLPFEPIWDTYSFGLQSLAAATAKTARARASERSGVLRLRSKTDPLAHKPCAKGGMICLNQDRFRFEVTWATPDGTSGIARGMRWSPDSGYFWFLDRDDVEVVFKVLDGCAVNGHYWLYGAGLTDAEVEVRVTDSRSGETRTYFNPLGAAFQPILDTSAFAGCP